MHVKSIDYLFDAKRLGRNMGCRIVRRVQVPASAIIKTEVFAVGKRGY